jgi:aerobic-type carbon monoxide dehydrogenase small subunit (CoxS/CutS family)
MRRLKSRALYGRPKRTHLRELDQRRFARECLGNRPALNLQPEKATPGTDVQMIVDLKVNGESVTFQGSAGTLLLDFIRDELGLTGTKRSCEIQVCGACTVLVNGLPASSCCMMIGAVGGKSVVTIEGLSEESKLDPIQESFLSHTAYQCGFCTSGFIMAIAGMRNYLASQQEIADRLIGELSGSLCRCTGYKPIVAAARCSLLGECHLEGCSARRRAEDG